MARGGLLDVPGDERGPLESRRPVRRHHEPELRRPTGEGQPHPPGQPGDGGRGGHRGPLRRRAGVGLQVTWENGNDPAGLLISPARGCIIQNAF